VQIFEKKKHEYLGDLKQLIVDYGKWFVVSKL
jgi:hypothetical protein